MSQVFISYRQTDDEQRRRVRDFAQSLKNCDIDVLLDQFVLEHKASGPNWPKWCSDRASETEYILIIGTKAWFECFEQKQPPGTGLGAAYEANIIRQRIYEAGAVIDNIRVVLFDDAEATNISLELRGYHRFHAERDFADIVRWLGGKLPRRRPSKVRTLNPKSVLIRRAKSVKLRRVDNPFQTVGALRHDHRTYIRRVSDGDFERVIARADRLISITGDFGIGKSSLMYQARRVLRQCQFFGGGLADLGGHDDRLFMKNFFGLFARRFGPINEWNELQDHVSQCPSVLLLDDIGEVALPGLWALIPALVTRLVQSQLNLRVIATSSQPLKALFSNRASANAQYQDLANPKYSKPWTRISVTACDDVAARELLKLLPSRSQRIAMDKLHLIKEKSQFAPQPLQCLCYRLFDGECDEKSDEELSSLIANSASYE